MLIYKPQESQEFAYFVKSISYILFSQI